MSHSPATRVYCILHVTATVCTTFYLQRVKLDCLAIVVATQPSSGKRVGLSTKEETDVVLIDLIDWVRARASI